MVCVSWVSAVVVFLLSMINASSIILSHPSYPPPLSFQNKAMLHKTFKICSLMGTVYQIFNFIDWIQLSSIFNKAVSTNRSSRFYYTTHQFDICKSILIFLRFYSTTPHLSFVMLYVMNICKLMMRNFSCLLSHILIFPLQFHWKSTILSICLYDVLLVAACHHCLRCCPLLKRHMCSLFLSFCDNTRLKYICSNYHRLLYLIACCKGLWWDD